MGVILASIRGACYEWYKKLPYFLSYPENKPEVIDLFEESLYKTLQDSRMKSIIINPATQQRNRVLKNEEGKNSENIHRRS